MRTRMPFSQTENPGDSFTFHSLPVAFRAWTVTMPKRKTKKTKPKRKMMEEGWRSAPPGLRVLVMDTETTTDPLQNLLFGSFQLYQGDALQIEGLFYGEDLPKEQLAVLEAVAEECNLPLYPVREFLDRIFYPQVYELGTRLVGFNLPFDLSRLAIQAYPGRKQWDSFRFKLSRNLNWPDVQIQSVNSKMAFIQFVPPWKAGRAKLIPGDFVDLRTLAHALTSESHSLESACKLFQVEHGKIKAEEHGKITPEYVDYNRRDVLASFELYLKLREEYERHPLTLPMNKAYSPASIGKAYLKAMGIKPFLEKQPAFPREILGYAMASYYGGRSECHIRKEVVPVTYLDVTSMYPSVFVLQGLWRWVTAKKIKPVDATQEVRAFLESVNLEGLFVKERWLSIPALVQIVPEGDILPVRAAYGEGALQIGLNHFAHGQPCWFTLADVLASKLLTGKTPRIVKAFRFLPQGIQEGLKPVSLRGKVNVNPSEEDFFKKIIEERQRIKKRIKTCTDPNEKAQLEALQQFLKILANSTSYGIFAELNEEKGAKTQAVQVHGQEAYSSEIAKIEKPGTFANPLIATFVTGAARLILAMMERFVAEHGTTYAFCDTDSLAVVRKDSLVAEKLVKQFEALNPYAFRGSLLKIERENFSQEDSKNLEPLFFYGISSKRYVLFNLREGKPIIRKFSEHGLGHLLAPYGQKEESAALAGEEEETELRLASPDKGRKWIQDLWEFILREELKLPPVPPPWLDELAVGKLAMSKPFLWKPFRKRKNLYSQQTKPFNFLLVAFPVCGEEENGKAIRPVAPFEKNYRKWGKLPWVSLYSGKLVSLEYGPYATHSNFLTLVKTFRDVLAQYRYHPEAKAAGSDGNPCGKQTKGELQRLHIVSGSIKHIGKESNQLEIVQVLGTADEVQAVYRPGWENLREKLTRYSPKLLVKYSGLSPKGIYKLLRGKTEPQAKTLMSLEQALEKLEGIKDAPSQFFQ